MINTIKVNREPLILVNNFCMSVSAYCSNPLGNSRETSIAFFLILVSRLSIFFSRGSTVSDGAYSWVRASAVVKEQSRF